MSIASLRSSNQLLTKRDVPGETQAEASSILEPRDVDDFEVSLLNDLDQGDAPSEAGGPDASNKSRVGSGKSAASLQARWTGRMLGKFRLSKILGHGGMGVVFQARDSHLKRTVALKILRGRVAGAEKAQSIEMFFREARAVASLDHPNIVQIYEIANFKGWWYIAMEYLEGGSIQQVVKTNGPMEPLHAAMLAADAARGLEEAHDNGIIHRDVKPGNLMLARKGRCKVADFGLVRFDDPNDPFSINRASVGTPLFLAPEIIQRKQATPASDVYGLGISLYYSLSGKMPYRGATKKEIFQLHTDAPIPDVREVAPNCSKNLASLIIKTMAKNPAERPSAATLATILQTEVASLSSGRSSVSAVSLNASAFETSETLATSSSQISQIVRPASRIKPWVVAGIAAAGVAFVVAAAGVYLGQRSLAQSAVESGPDAPADPAALVPADITEVVDVQAQANVQWRQIEQLAPGQGFHDLIIHAEVSKNKGDGYYGAKRLRLARNEYETFNRKAKEILQLDKLRQTALASKAAAEDAAKEANETADAVNKAAHFISPETATQIAITDGNRNEAKNDFEKGNFETATTKWKLAIFGYRKATNLAQQYVDLRRIRREYRELLATVKTADLDRDGREAWQAVKALVKTDVPDAPPGPAIAAYGQAIPSLNQAIAAAADARALRAKQQADAQVEQEAQTRAKHIDSLFQQARQLDSPRQGRAAVSLLDELLALDPQNKPASQLKDKILAYYNFKPGQTIAGSQGILFAYVPAGHFQMGSPVSEPGRNDDERRHGVTLTHPYFISVAPITQGQWAKVMGSARTDLPKAFVGDDLPVIGVTWDQAVEFTHRLSQLEDRVYRLPTEAEWEYAARAGSTTVFSLGDNLTTADADIDGTEPRVSGAAPSAKEAAYKRPLPIASFRPNAWNLYDVHGNVQQWCSDFYGPYPIGDVTDPAGLNVPGAPRVLRGGSWKRPASAARSASRASASAADSSDDVGFRVVLEAQ